MIRRAARKVRYTARYYALRVTGLQWIFVLGHMRSGSSLLVHLLNSSEEILGYGETHLDYVGQHSLVALHDRVQRKFENHGEASKGSHRYVVDKILWPHIHDESILRQAPLKIIVIARAPEDALPSILSRDLEEVQSPAGALEYYRNTLKRTERNLKIYNASFVLVRYEDLTSQTEQTLQKISAYLGLGKVLNSEYNMMWPTGKSGIGDSSERIKTGTVVSSPTAYEVDIGEEILSKARLGYQQFLYSCRAKSHCICSSGANHG